MGGPALVKRGLQLRDNESPLGDLVSMIVIMTLSASGWEILLEGNLNMKRIKRLKVKTGVKVSGEEKYVPPPNP